MSPEQRRARAYAAKALIDDPTLKQGWDNIESSIRQEWEGTNLLQRRKRERLWMQLRAIRALRQELASFAGHARD